MTVALTKDFEPLHISATHADMEGNNGRGRYLFVPGSDDRSKEISTYFDQEPIVRKSSRAHNVYLGTITKNGKTIDVGVVSTGMGTPSADIIITELLKLGGGKFLRLGTAGSLQPEFMPAGSFGIATGSVRDESATSAYVPPEYPALASFEMLEAISQASGSLEMNEKTRFGLFHTKASLYAREFKQGPMQEENSRYMQILKNSGVIASEMESAMLFTLTTIYDGLRQERNRLSTERVLAGAICSILGEGDDFGTEESRAKMTKEMIALGIETFFQLNQMGY